MKVLVVGAAGALGGPVVDRLHASGYDVAAITRSARNKPLLERRGIETYVADALDAPALHAAVRAAGPEMVVQALSALPKDGAMRTSQLAPNNRLWRTGTANVVDAAVAAGARRLVAASFVAAYGFTDLGDRPRIESDEPAPVPSELSDGRDAALALESQVLQANRNRHLEGIALRFGFYYGPGIRFTEYARTQLKRWQLPLLGGGRGVSSWIHIQDAADAVEAALRVGQAGEIYNVVDNHPVTFKDYACEFARLLGAPKPIAIPRFIGRLVAPYPTGFMSDWRVPVSNAKARRDLGWNPRFPTYREGLVSLVGPRAEANVVQSAGRV